MSEIKKHYMRVKRKILQEEVFSDGLSKIVRKRFSPEPNRNVSASVTQSELSESNTLESNLLLHNESDESNECLPLLSPDLINSNIYTNIQQDNSEEDIKLNLVQWSLKHSISHTALSDLLKLLKFYIPELPIDARSLLGTCRKVTSKVIEPGQYYHFGVEKSSGSQVYPILCRLIKDHSNVVDMIGIYHGYEKPKEANCYLSDFVEDISKVINTGIVIHTKHYSVKISYFVCDTVAKAYITYTVGHMGYCSCTKCHEEGTYINNRVCFPNTNHINLRTDSDYRSKAQEDHHNGTSLLEQIPGLDMVKSFPLDYMHLICLGVVKKLIVNLWGGVLWKTSCKIIISEYYRYIFKFN